MLNLSRWNLSKSLRKALRGESRAARKKRQDEWEYRELKVKFLPLAKEKAAKMVKDQGVRGACFALNIMPKPKDYCPTNKMPIFQGYKIPICLKYGWDEVIDLGKYIADTYKIFIFRPWLSPVLIDKRP